MPVINNENEDAFQKSIIERWCIVKKSPPYIMSCCPYSMFWTCMNASTKCFTDKIVPNVLYGYLLAKLVYLRPPSDSQIFLRSKLNK